jgi:rhamnosyltransferase
MATRTVLSSRPSVGILLTTYNGTEFLPAQLDSLLAQTGVSLHVYVFDDCSSDATMDLLRRYAADHPGLFSLTENRPNSGGTGLNILRNLPTVPDSHDFYALADQDDVWLPQKLARAVEILSRDGTGLYFSDLQAWDGQDGMLGTVHKATPLAVRDHLLGGGSAGCTYVMSAAFFAHLKARFAAVDLGGVRRISHDWIIYFLARHDGFGVSPSPDALIHYRIHPDSQYGGMSLGGLGAIRRKLKMLQAGFLRDQTANTLKFAHEGTEDRAILVAFRKGRLQRLGILARYRFSLARSRSRLLSLLVAALFLY